jgi:hypothetical protein
MDLDPAPPPATAPDRGVRALAFHPDCPTRPPHWRWRRAEQLFENAARPRRWDDLHVRRARDYLAGLRRCLRRGDKERLAARLPDVHEARALHRGEPHRRWEVEARLLACEPIEQIAHKTVGEPSAVAAYAQLFFDVTGRMGNPGYIIHCAVGLYRAPTGPDDGRILRLVGFFGGPCVVDALVTGQLDVAQPLKPDELPAFMSRFVGNQILIKALVAALTMRVDGRAGRALLRTWGRFEASERRLRRAAPTADDLLPRVELMSQHFPDLSVLAGGDRG